MFQVQAISKQLQIDAKVAELSAKGVASQFIQDAVDFLQEHLYPDDDEEG